MLTNLPADCLWRCLTFLDLSSLSRCRLCCRWFQSDVVDADELWEQLFLRDATLHDRWDLECGVSGVASEEEQGAENKIDRAAFCGDVAVIRGTLARAGGILKEVPVDEALDWLTLRWRGVYRAMLDPAFLHGGENRFRVFGRARPPLAREVAEHNSEFCVSTHGRSVVVFGQEGDSNEAIMLPRCFWSAQNGGAIPFTSQSDLYATVGKPMLRDVRQGISSCALAFGQNSTGKHFTMFGFCTNESCENDGLFQRFVEEIFKLQGGDCTVKVELSVLRHGMEKIIDLLDDESKRFGAMRELRQVREITRPVVKDAKWEPICSSTDARRVLNYALSNGAICNVFMGGSKRFESTIAQLRITTFWPQTCCVKQGFATFVALCASDRPSKTFATSFSAQQQLKGLINVIKQMAAPQAPKFLPLRDSKLTRFLGEELKGEARLSLICCFSPCIPSYAETSHTLKFARAAASAKWAAVPTPASWSVENFLALFQLNPGEDEEESAMAQRVRVGLGGSEVEEWVKVQVANVH